MSHPGIDQHVHVGKVGERDQTGAEQPGPVNVVVHVVRVHPQTGDIEDDPFLSDIVFILIF